MLVGVLSGAVLVGREEVLLGEVVPLSPGVLFDDGVELDEDGEEFDDGEELDGFDVDGELFDVDVELDGEFDVEVLLLFDEPASLLPEPGSSPPLRPAAFSRPLRACRPAREPNPSRNDSVNVCPEFFTASLNSSAPAFPVRPRS
ncbi:hypothetical protein ACWCYY_40790 [Kitasatospora sp. NPDC001664]